MNAPARIAQARSGPSLDESTPLNLSAQAVVTSSGKRFWVVTPRWLLLAALVFAPTAYGSTRPWSVLWLSSLLAMANAWWLLECWARRRWPAVPVAALGLVTWLLVQGWWMTANARAVYRFDLGVLLPVQPGVPGAPGSVDRSLSLFTMLIVSNLLVALLFTCDLARRPLWRKRLWMTLALTGAFTALVGLALKLGGPSAMALVWENEKVDLTNNFAAFRYRGNAGAFLNLTLPLLAGFTWLTLARPDRPWTKSFWASSLLILLAGIQFNPSRASWAIAMALVALFAGLALWHAARRASTRAQPAVLLGYLCTALLLGAALLSIVALCGWESSWSRMARWGVDTTQRAPLAVYRTMVPEAGWTGFGPGTFEAIFPAYQLTHAYPDEPTARFWSKGYWRHAHHDYYQTVIEWGYLGALAWALLLLGGVLAGLRKLRRGRFTSSSDWLVAGCVLALGGVLLHAWVDFPLQVASIQLFVVVLLGICWSTPTPLRQRTA